MRRIIKGHKAKVTTCELVNDIVHILGDTCHSLFLAVVVLSPHADGVINDEQNIKVLGCKLVLGLDHDRSHANDKRKNIDDRQTRKGTNPVPCLCFVLNYKIRCYSEQYSKYCQHCSQRKNRLYAHFCNTNPAKQPIARQINMMIKGTLGRSTVCLVITILTSIASCF